jgi:hypothetical protein
MKFVVNSHYPLKSGPNGSGLFPRKQQNDLIEHIRRKDTNMTINKAAIIAIIAELVVGTLGVIKLVSLQAPYLASFIGFLMGLFVSAIFNSVKQERIN